MDLRVGNIKPPLPPNIEEVVSNDNMASKLENVPMTAEMQQLANDPNFVVEFAVGAPIPDLIPQSKDSGIKINGVYFDKTKRYGKQE